MKNKCQCGSCDYCKGFLKAQMDLEFGGAHRGAEPKTVVDMVRNIVCYQHRIDMCNEFGYGPEGAAKVRARLKKEFHL